MKNITTALMCFSFTITIFAQNDICTDAISVSCGDSVTGTTVGATSTGAPTASCGTTSGAPGVWYEFTGTGQDITFSLCGSSYDTKIQVYTGDCSDLICVDGNDDSCSTQSEVSITSTENESYFVYVFGWSSSVGDYTLEVSCEDAPEPPSCGETIFDSGGANGNYSDDESTTVTVFPDNPGDVVTFTFLSFDIESGFDFLTVYNGPDTSSTEIGEFTGSTIPDPITSTDISGALTFVFESDFLFNDLGYEILITCAPPPTCLAPTDFETSNVTASSVDISWTANNGESQWEYVIQTQGTGIPTTAGTPMTTNPYTITGLDSGTDYEIFIRAICDGGDSSEWTSPVNITTSPACGDTIFDSGGANGNYSNNELITVTVFPENPGDVVTFTFNFFDIENNWDFLYVYDGPNNTSPIVGTFTGSTAPDPITSTDDTGALTFVFDSDSFFQYGGYEILVTCAPPPTCLAPTGLNVSNISGTTADFDWETQNGNESWEYVIVPNGDPAPTAAGVFTAVNSTTFTDLEFLTSYDVYVRASCGMEDGYSTWSGPETFTTTQQTNYTVDCASGQAVNIQYCYTNNDSTFWLFTSTDGFPLKITFNAGTIEGFWDDLTIYDGPDNTSPVLFNNNDADIEDFTDLVVESTSTAVYIEVDSDGIGSCESSFGYTPWDFDVSCKTCITQTVEFDIVGSCEPNQEFYVEANITDMGSASNLELSDNQGSATQTATAISVLTFGPYAANTQVVISVLNTDDTSCLLESDPLTFLCPPPPNECSIVYAGEDTTFCSDNDPATELTAYYHITGQDTTSYEITVQQNCPTPSLVGGTPTSLDIDDEWSEVIDLGFEFCFFGDTYSQILIGSNGVLSFELDNADGFNEFSIETGDNLPNSSNFTLSEANIFGVAHDIDPSEGGEINYVILGSAPARQFVVNYVDVPAYDFLPTVGYETTSQIIIYESSNVIDINIYEKPIYADWNDGLSVVGIQNIDDTIAFTPTNRNTGVWEATNEFWRFSPSVGDANYVFEWYDGDTLIGTDDTITVYPEETTTYTAAVTYNLCNGETATVTDTVLVEIKPTPIPVAVENDVFICAGEEAVLEVNIDASAQSPDVVYYWTYDNVDIQSGPENTFMFAEGAQAYGEYLVTAYNEETACYASTVINVLPGIFPELEQDTSFNKCINGEVELSVNIINDPEMTSEYNYAWYVDNELIAEDTSGSFIHGEDLINDPVVVIVTSLTTSCASETIINVNYFQNQNCVDIPQGISPNGDGLNDCLVLDHLEEQEDIVKAEIYNRYGVKVFELNDYVDHWCGQDASSGSSDELLPVGTYFYVIQYASGREPTISWIYLNY
ncbi:gliding motility-associated C-terminal domain-containing protein [Flavobacteriaceae bacterium]|jgi:gliding motility-associated-like protein|nr:gliding motility-associated C-terminal domain-containing protein [Flavobacteriaceae bacterium]